MDAVLAVRFRPFLGGKRGQDVGGIHGCGDQDGMCQPLPRSWGTNNSGLLARSLRTGGPSQHWEIMYVRITQGERGE